MLPLIHNSNESHESHIVFSSHSSNLFVMNQSGIILNRLVMHPVQSDIPEHEEQFLVFNDEDDGFLKSLNINLNHEAFPNVVQIVFIAIGLVGSLLSALVFSRPRMAASVYTLRMVVEIASFVVISTFIPDVVRDRYPTFTVSRESVSLSKAINYAQLSSVFVANWGTVLVAFWRYVGIKWPTKAYNWCSRSRSHLALMLVFATSLVLAIPPSLLFSEQEVKFFAYDRSTETYYSTSIYRSVLSDWALAKRGLLMTVSRIVLILTTTIPMVLLTIATLLSIATLIKTKRSRSQLFSLEDQGKHNNKKIHLMLGNVVSTYGRFLIGYLLDSVANVAVLFDDRFPDNLDGDHLKLFRVHTYIMMAYCGGFFFNYLLSVNFRNAFLEFCIPSISKKRSSLISNTLNSVQ